MNSPATDTVYCVSQGCHAPIQVNVEFCPECGARQKDPNPARPSEWGMERVRKEVACLIEEKKFGQFEELNNAWAFDTDYKGIPAFVERKFATEVLQNGVILLEVRGKK